MPHMKITLMDNDLFDTTMGHAITYYHGYFTMSGSTTVVLLVPLVAVDAGQMFSFVRSTTITLANLNIM